MTQAVRSHALAPVSKSADGAVQPDLQVVGRSFDVTPDDGATLVDADELGFGAAAVDAEEDAPLAHSPVV